MEDREVPLFVNENGLFRGPRHLDSGRMRAHRGRRIFDDGAFQGRSLEGSE